jgi:NADH:ubiquinone oxidoreductase subunit D
LAEPPAHDPELEAALRAVLQIIHKDHPLRANQILVLAAELQRLGVHRLVEEHLAKFGQRQG